MGFKNFIWVSSVTSSLNSDGLKGYMDLGQKLSGQIGPCFKSGETSKAHASSVLKLATTDRREKGRALSLRLSRVLEVKFNLISDRLCLFGVRLVALGS